MRWQLSAADAGASPEMRPLVGWIVAQLRRLDPAGCGALVAAQTAALAPALSRSDADKTDRLAAQAASQRGVLAAMAEQQAAFLMSMDLSSSEEENAREDEDDDGEAEEEEEEEVEASGEVGAAAAAATETSARGGGGDTCILCHEDIDAAALSATDAGYVGFMQQCHGGVHFSSCGHALHRECWNLYSLSLIQRHHQNGMYEGQHTIDVTQGEFLCPLCKTVANSIFPTPAPGRNGAAALPPAASAASSSGECDSATALLHQRLAPVFAALATLPERRILRSAPDDLDVEIDAACVRARASLGMQLPLPPAPLARQSAAGSESESASARGGASEGGAQSTREPHEKRQRRAAAVDDYDGCNDALESYMVHALTGGALPGAAGSARLNSAVVDHHLRRSEQNAAMECVLEKIVPVWEAMTAATGDADADAIVIVPPDVRFNSLVASIATTLRGNSAAKGSSTAPSSDEGPLTLFLLFVHFFLRFFSKDFCFFISFGCSSIVCSLPPSLRYEHRAVLRARGRQRLLGG